MIDYNQRQPHSIANIGSYKQTICFIKTSVWKPVNMSSMDRLC